MISNIRKLPWLWSHIIYIPGVFNNYNITQKLEATTTKLTVAFFHEPKSTFYKWNFRTVLFFLDLVLRTVLFFLDLVLRTVLFFLDLVLRTSWSSWAVIRRDLREHASQKGKQCLIRFIRSKVGVNMTKRLESTWPKGWSQHDQKVGVNMTKRYSIMMLTWLTHVVSN